MRKVLLTSTALVAFASVASAADITISGDTVFNYKSISDSTSYGAGKDGNSMASDGNLAVSSTATSDSGLTYTTSYDVDADSGDISISGDFGKLTIVDGTDGDGDAAAMSGDGTIANVGIKLDEQFQCPQCRQAFDSAKANQLHWNFIHDPNRHEED